MRFLVVLMVFGAACGRIGFDSIGSDADLDVDTDGDGIPDVVDNCPMVPNPAQDNEDGDRFGDACDPCPPYADADPIADQDGDGLPDLCDPNPTVAGDSLTLFDGFDHGEPAGATVIGSWTFMNGEASVVSSLDVFSTVGFDPPSGSAVTVSTHATIDMMIGSFTGRGTGVIQQLDPATSDGVGCVVGLDDNNLQLFAIVDNQTNNVSAMDPITVMNGSSSTVSSTRSGAQSYGCTASIDPSSPIASTDSYTSTDPKVGIHTRSTSSHFDWVMIVRTE